MSFLSDLLGGAYKEGMTEEEISKALEVVKQNDDAELNKYKNALSKANSEAADYKKKLREKQGEDEAKRAEEQEKIDQILQENADLKRSMSIAEKKTKLVAMGYDEKMAGETAIAMIDGDIDKVLENQGKYLETQKKTIETELLKGTPRPKAGGDGKVPVDYDKLIEESEANGNYTASAYYSRLKVSESENNGG